MSDASLEGLTPMQRARLALANKLMENPETADEAKRLLKKVDPSFKDPALELQDRIAAETKAREEGMQKLREERETDKRNAWYAEKCKQIRALGLDVEKVEAIMKDKKIADYDTAVEYLQQQTSLAVPTHDSVTPMELPSDKGLWENPKKNARSLAHEMINEFKRNRTAAL
jgi:hypothetical protein